MAKKAYGTIDGVKWSTLKQTDYEVILDVVDNSSSPGVVELMDEEDNIVLSVVTGANKRTIKVDATITGDNHFGVNGLVDTVITVLSGADIPTPLQVIANSSARNKGDFMKCSMTCVYIPDATEVDMDVSPTTTTTTTTTTV